MQNTALLYIFFIFLTKITHNLFFLVFIAAIV